MTHNVQMLITYLQVPGLQYLSLKALLMQPFKSSTVPRVQVLYMIFQVIPPNCKYNQISSTSYEDFVPMGYGINPLLIDFQKTLNKVDTSQVTVIKVDFTNLSFYCHAHKNFNAIVQWHNIKPYQGVAFFYYVQYSDCWEMCYFVKCQKVYGGQLLVELFFSVSILPYFHKC